MAQAVEVFAVRPVEAGEGGFGEGLVFVVDEKFDAVGLSRALAVIEADEVDAFVGAGAAQGFADGVLQGVGGQIGFVARVFGDGVADVGVEGDAVERQALCFAAAAVEGVEDGVQGAFLEVFPVAAEGFFDGGADIAVGFVEQAAVGQGGFDVEAGDDGVVVALADVGEGVEGGGNGEVGDEFAVFFAHLVAVGGEGGVEDLVEGVVVAVLCGGGLVGHGGFRRFAGCFQTAFFRRPLL